jgi:hypothetical protein
MCDSNRPNIGNRNTNSTSSSAAYLYGFKLGKNAALRGYYDIMNDCSYRAYLLPNGTNTTKHFTVQDVNDCDSGYEDGWNKYCHIGLPKHPEAAASCTKTQITSSQY